MLRLGGRRHESGEATRKPLVQSGSFTVLVGLQSIFWITLLKQKACKKCYLQIEKFEATVKEFVNIAKREFRKETPQMVKRCTQNAVPGLSGITEVEALGT